MIVEGTHEPIIDPVLWNKVQALIAQRAKPFDTGQIGLFARKARCANCGYVMRSSKNRGRHYLQCQTRHVSNDACIGAFIPVNELEQIVLNELHRLSDEYLDRDELERNIEFTANLNDQREQILDDIAMYERKIGEYTKGIKDLYMDKMRGILKEGDFTSLSADFSAEKGRLEELLKSEQKKLAEIEERLAAGDNRQELIEQYLGLKSLNREIVEILIDHINIGRRDRETGEIPIEIHWNF